MARGGSRKNSGRKKGTITKKTKVLRERLRKSLELTADATIEQMRRGSQFDIRALFDVNGRLKPLKDLTAEEAMPIAGFEVVRRNLTSGDGATDEILKVKLIDRSRYVEMAAKHHGLLIEKVQLLGPDSLGAKVARARGRLQPAKSDA